MLIMISCSSPKIQWLWPTSAIEIINEPFAGNIYSNPLLLLPGVAGQLNLQPFYDAIALAIRSEDEAHLIFYEPVTWGMVLNGQIVGSGFDHVPGGKEQRAKSVFSFHYYCWFMTANATSFIRTVCDKVIYSSMHVNFEDIYL